MGIVDQFTDVAVFPDLCMDTMLPPGMLRNKTLGLDKSLMGLEMCGGGGNTTTHVENKYDDQWIKDTFADYTQKYKAYTAGQAIQDSAIGAAQQGIAGLATSKAGKGWTEGKIADLNKQLTKSFNQQFADLNIGDIAGLNEQLTSIFQQSELSDKQLMDQLSAVKENYADKDYVSGALSGLEKSLTSDFDTQLSGVQSELAGDISALGTDFAGKLAESEKTGAQNLADVKAAIESDYGSQITDLSDTFGTKLSDTAASLTDTFGQKYDTLSDQLAGAESDLAAHKSDTESKFADVASQYSGLSTDLADLGTDTATKFSEAWTGITDLGTDTASKFSEAWTGIKDVGADVTALGESTDAKFDQAYKDARTMYDVIDDDISDLDLKFGTQLGAAKDHMAAQLKSTDEALNKRLTDISKSMNYRMLGNTASGVKIRRSKGFTRGAPTRGTGQLARKMKIGNLNL